jgi:hypothetical protein
MSGRVWEQYGKVRYYLHRWPSPRAMNNARARIQSLTGQSRVGVDLEDTIAALNLFLRGRDSARVAACESVAMNLRGIGPEAPGCTPYRSPRSNPAYVWIGWSRRNALIASATCAGCVIAKEWSAPFRTTS